MKKIFLIVLACLFVFGCETNKKEKGVKYFYSNYQDFALYLGSRGKHHIKSVIFTGNYMVIKYSYKNGELSGYIKPNGNYTGTYRTSSSTGDFTLKFDESGSAIGDWSCSNCFISVSDSLAIVPK
jgi:hypothetical protein